MQHPIRVTLSICALILVALSSCKYERRAECQGLPNSERLATEECRVLKLEKQRLKEKRLGVPPGSIAPKK